MTDKPNPQKLTVVDGEEIYLTPALEKARETHPGGKNLRPMTSSKARENQRLSQIKREENTRKRKEKKESMELAIEIMKENGQSPGEFDGLEVMKIIAADAFAKGDLEVAGKFAEKIAQYQHPKRNSVDSTVTTIDFKKEATEDELKSLISGEWNVFEFEEAIRQRKGG